jgi:hypothetical protein
MRAQLVSILLAALLGACAEPMTMTPQQAFDGYLRDMNTASDALDVVRDEESARTAVRAVAAFYATAHAYLDAPFSMSAVDQAALERLKKRGEARFQRAAKRFDRSLWRVWENPSYRPLLEAHDIVPTHVPSDDY